MESMIDGLSRTIKGVGQERGRDHLGAVHLLRVRWAAASADLVVVLVHRRVPAVIVLSEGCGRIVWLACVLILYWDTDREYKGRDGRWGGTY